MRPERFGSNAFLKLQIHPHQKIPPRLRVVKIFLHPSARDIAVGSVGFVQAARTIFRNSTKPIASVFAAIGNRSMPE